MTSQLTEAGTTPTAPDSAPDNAHNPKVMVLAVHRSPDGEIVLTPIDVEHETDDQSPMSENEQKAKKILDELIKTKQDDMKAALKAMYEIFAHRLYRSQFRNFENYCFAIHGTYRINDELMKKARKKAKELGAELEEEQ